MKSNFFQIRLTPCEKTVLEMQAERLGMTISEYVRTAAIYSRSSPVVAFDVQPLRGLLFELGKQGNNLNQIARQLNTSGMRGFLPSVLEETLKKNMALYGQLQQTLIGLQRAMADHRVYYAMDKTADESL